MTQLSSALPPPLDEAAAFRLLMENVTDFAIIFLDPNRRITCWNLGAQQLLGYTEAEILGHSADVIFTPEDRQQGAPEKEVHQAQTEGRAEDERWHLRKDGSRFWGSGVMTCLKDEAGQDYGCAKIMRDLTRQKQAQEQRDSLTAQVHHQEQQTAILMERTRMAQELHDTLSQGFTGIKLQLDAAEEHLHGASPVVQAHLLRAREIAVQNLEEARRAISALRASVLEAGDLVSALQHLVEQTTAETQITAQLQVQGKPSDLPAEVESDLFRIAQEALTNALRHAHARHITLALRYAPTQVRLRVQDDGRGFDLSAVEAGLGLRGMQERAQRLGGSFTLRSQPGKGTRIHLTVSYRHQT